VKYIKRDVAKRLGVDEKELNRMYHEAVEYNNNLLDECDNSGIDDYLDFIKLKCLICFRLHRVDFSNIWYMYYCNDCINRYKKKLGS